MATPSSILAWKIPWTEEPWRLQSMRLQKNHTQLSNQHFHFHSHPYTTIGKTITLIIQTFVGKVMSLFFNMLSRFVITFLPGSKCLLISRLQSPSTVLLEPKKIKSVTISIFSPSTFHEAMRLDAMILDFLMLNFKPTFSLSSKGF